jgi:hypothetical protein
VEEIAEVGWHTGKNAGGGATPVVASERQWKRSSARGITRHGVVTRSGGGGAMVLSLTLTVEGRIFFFLRQRRRKV